MADRAFLVEGDAPPRIVLDLLDESTGAPMDLDGLTGAVLRWRPAGAIGATVREIAGAPDLPGGVRFDLPSEVMSGVGRFEAEVRLLFGARRLTLFEPLKFTIRQQFA